MNMECHLDLSRMAALPFELTTGLFCLCQLLSYGYKARLWYGIRGYHILCYSCWRTVRLCLHNLIWPWTSASRVKTDFPVINFLSTLSMCNVFKSLLPPGITIDTCICWHIYVKFSLLYFFSKYEFSFTSLYIMNDLFAILDVHF